MMYRWLLVAVCSTNKLVIKTSSWFITLTEAEFDCKHWKDNNSVDYPDSWKVITQFEKTWIADK